MVFLRRLWRPYRAHEPFDDENSRSPYLVANAFRFSELRDRSNEGIDG